MEQQKRRREGSTLSQKKKKKHTPESELKFSLENSSKSGDVMGALAIYDNATAKLNQYTYNLILYLCSSAALGVLAPKKDSGDSEMIEEDGVLFRGTMASLVSRNKDGDLEIKKIAQTRGMEIYELMRSEGVVPNESTFTSLARLAVAKRDGDLAFGIVKEMISANLSPKLRSYGPALYTFFKNNDIEKALKVDAHMIASGVKAEEMELEVLLRLCCKRGLYDKVYEFLHRIRSTVREVSSSTANCIESWFKSDAASEAVGTIPEQKMQEEVVKKAMESKGGGWHGLGWMGKGKWVVEHSNLTADGICSKCSTKIVTIDIEVQQSIKFAESLAELACQREHNNNNSFKSFQSWLKKYGPYSAIVDGANVAMYNQNFEEGGFSFSQLSAVVEELEQKFGKAPLVVLHEKRTKGATDAAKELLNKWREANALYCTPTGSNDDWYWLYAAVECNSLLVSNDEMRDHLFQLLSSDIFSRWKERHQTRFHVSNRQTVLHMPPSYSTVIQESEKGAWHIPKASSDEWLCISRSSQ